MFGNDRLFLEKEFFEHMKCGACLKATAEERYAPYLFCPFCGKNYPEDLVHRLKQENNRQNYVANRILLAAIAMCVLFLIPPILIITGKINDFLGPDYGLYAIFSFLGFLMITLILFSVVLKSRAKKFFPD